MEWSGRAPAPPGTKLQGVPKTRSTPCPRTSTRNCRIGIDIGKNSLHVVGLDDRGAICCVRDGRVARSKRGWPICRGSWSAWKLATVHITSVGSCKTFGPRRPIDAGEDVRPYSKGQKNDFRDAEAIAEAVQRPTMKFVATKIAEQPTCRPCIAFASDWSGSALASSIKSAPSC